MGRGKSDDFWENTSSVEDRLIFDDDSGVVQRGVVFAVLFKDSTVFLAGLGFAVFFFRERGVFLGCLCDFWMGEHVQLSFQDKTRRRYIIKQWLVDSTYL